MFLPELSAPDKEIVDVYKRLLQLEFPEDAAIIIIRYEDEIFRRMSCKS